MTDPFSSLDLAAVSAARQPGRTALGVDVGGTKIAFGLLDAATLTLRDRRVIPAAPERGGAEVLRDVARQVEDMATLSRERPAGIGVAVPEIVSRSGRITSSAVIPGWNELPVAETLTKTAPARVESDVRAAAFAEAVLGAGRDLGYFVFLTVGTGISYCAVADGRPLAGVNGGALNAGTSTLVADQPTLEEAASGAALVRRYVARGGRAERAEDVITASEEGDEAARAVLAQGARALGVGIALLINLLDPEAVILGGGLGSAHTPYGDAAERWAAQYVHRFAAATPVRRGALGADAGVIGAALTGLLAAS